jgi:predicted RNase H-like nuclease (RuvC/YqgF family)
MKLTTIPAFFGRSIKIYDDTEVKFDNTGSLEVSDKVGKILLEKYPSMMFDPNKKEEVTALNSTQEYTKEVVQRLEAEVFSLKDQIKEIKDAKLGVETDLAAWQEKVGEFQSKVEKAQKDLENERLTNLKLVDTLELKVALTGQTVAALQQLATDAKYKKEEWEKLTKENLIGYILNKS